MIGDYGHEDLVNAGQHWHYDPEQTVPAHLQQQRSKHH